MSPYRSPLKLEGPLGGADKYIGTRLDTAAVTVHIRQSYQLSDLFALNQARYLDRIRSLLSVDQQYLQGER